MPAGIVVRGDFPLFMTPMGTKMLRKRAWEPTEDMPPELRDLYYQVDSTDDPFYQSYGTIGMGNVIRKRETEAFRFDAPAMGRPFTMVFPTYGLATAISREAQMDDKSNELMPMITRELKRAMIETQEQDAANQFNDGFTYQGWETDGVALFSTVHPLVRSQVGGPSFSSNRHPTDAALSIASLDAAYTQMRLTRNDTGRLINTMTPVFLDVHPNLMPYAMQLVGSEKVLGSNYNDKNIYYGKLTVRANPRFTNPNAWFLSAGDGKGSWLWMNRETAQFETHIDKMSMVTVLMTWARWGRGAEDWRGKYGSLGPA